jgi:hypothetical protein
LDSRSLDTGTLSDWIREVDVGEMALIIDACESASAIQAAGFKPGPMGDRGLGQLAYDKGIQVLAASRGSAYESSDLQHGVLHYALVQRGLREGDAREDPLAGITLRGWLKYGEREGRWVFPGLQQPLLFDFARSRGDIMIAAAQPGIRRWHHGESLSTSILTSLPQASQSSGFTARITSTSWLERSHTSRPTKG